MLLLAAFTFIAVFSTTFGENKFLFDEGTGSIEWKYLPTTKDLQFTVTMATATGWLGMGISANNSGMSQLDVYVGFIGNLSVSVSLI